jgi:hypothetical protein
MGKNQDPGSGINIPDPQHCLDPGFLVNPDKDPGFDDKIIKKIYSTISSG